VGIKSPEPLARPGLSHAFSQSAPILPQMGGAGKVAPGVAVSVARLSLSSAQILNELQ
jgi:hypothetical protein